MHRPRFAPLRAELISGKKERSAFQGQEQHGKNARLRLAELAGDAVLVMSADDPVRPSPLRNCVEVGVDRPLQRKRIPRGIEEDKVQGQMKQRTAIAVEMSDAIGLALNFAA